MSAVSEYDARMGDQSLRQRMFTLFDPERPSEDPNALAKRAPTNPRGMKHHCPMCCRSVTAAGCEAEAMEWDVFRAHLLGCYRRNRLTKLDITKRTFAGGTHA
jgi:hypothetical protein